MISYNHPYDYHPKYRKRVAYICMEFGIHQNLKIYSGGLGYLAGSHMRSAYDLRQNLIGVGVLWKYGYYDQIRRGDQGMDVLFLERQYSFLQDINIQFQINVHGHPVWVKVWYLAPNIFGTAPIYLLSTDVPENDHLARTICHRLYDSDPSAKLAQYTLLGQGSAKLFDALNYNPDIVHLNEGHGLPVAFELYKKLGSKEALKDKIVFTTHTPVPAGNESYNIHFLRDMGYFCGLPEKDIRSLIGINGDTINLTLAALRIAKKANGVSKMHGEVARKMWSDNEDICEIGHITNAQNYQFWKDDVLRDALDNNQDDRLWRRKKELKRQLFAIVADQTGKVFHEDILTVVWARRFAGYKRADMPIWEMEQFDKLLNNHKRPIQIIWAGKPYPMDHGARGVFDRIVHATKKYTNAAVLVGYELALSKALKHGSDIWLNTPRVTREASGTSGMTAAMNGSVNLSTFDGWVREFSVHNHNSFVIPEPSESATVQEQDIIDHKNLFELLNDTALPMYYDHTQEWLRIVKNGMQEVIPFFDSNRMASQYYEELYH